MVEHFVEFVFVSWFVLLKFVFSVWFDFENWVFRFAVFDLWFAFSYFCGSLISWGCFAYWFVISLCVEDFA